MEAVYIHETADRESVPESESLVITASKSIEIIKKAGLQYPFPKRPSYP